MWRLLTVVYLASAGMVSAQGPLDGYMKGKGQLDLVPSFSFNSARSFYGAGGQAYAFGFRGNTVSLFGEYGLTDNFDLVGTAAYVFTSEQGGLQDGGLFVKYRPWRREFQRGGRLGLVVGTGATFPLSDYEPTANGALGQKAVTVPARLIVQWETRSGLFFNVTGGYHFRLDHLQAADIDKVRQSRPDFDPSDPPSFFTALFKAGFPAAKYYLDGWLEYQHTSGGADYVPNLVDLPQAYGVSYLQAGGTLYYSESGKTGFVLSGAHIFSGRNVSGITRVTLGVVFKINRPFGKRSLQNRFYNRPG